MKKQTWKDLPHLFANRKFGIRYRGREVDTIVSYNPTGHHFTVCIDELDRSFRAGIFDGTFKLIARPISDMSDEELQEVVEMTPKDMGYKIVNPMEYLKHFIKNDLLPARIERYLLSIGVYPFDDETDVIFKNKEEL